MLRTVQRRVRDSLNGPVELSLKKSADIAPGAPWPHLRGDEVWTMTTDGQMFRREDGVQLDQLLGRECAGRLVGAFMKIRPSGGRVWVDDDRRAVTYVDNRLVFLGRLQRDENSASMQTALGTPLGEPEGRKYEVLRGGAIYRATGTNLATVVGKDVAAAVVKRLLQIRPGGGIYRVSGNGVAATWLDGQWVYAGTINANEWFPGHVR